MKTRFNAIVLIAVLATHLIGCHGREQVGQYSEVPIHGTTERVIADARQGRFAEAVALKGEERHRVVTDLLVIAATPRPIVISIVETNFYEYQREVPDQGVAMLLLGHMKEEAAIDVLIRDYGYAPARHALCHMGEACVEPLVDAIYEERSNAWNAYLIDVLVHIVGKDRAVSLIYDRYPEGDPHLRNDVSRARKYKPDRAFGNTSSTVPGYVRHVAQYPNATYDMIPKEPHNVLLP